MKIPPTKIAFFLFFSFALVIILLFVPMIQGKRNLTDEEHKVLQSIYQNNIDLEKITIKSGGPLTWVYPGITIGNTIAFPKNKYDFSIKKYQALLVHEACHVWQYQHFGLDYIPHSLWELLTQRDTYVIHYDSSKKLREYDIEEQCEIIAEYFLSEDKKYSSYIDELGNTE